MATGITARTVHYPHTVTSELSAATDAVQPGRWLEEPVDRTDR